MNAAHNSLLENFTSMQEEFSSSNNREIRDVYRLFDNNLDDLLSSLKYFNNEYVVIDVRELDKLFNKLRDKLKEVWTAHVSMYTDNFDKVKDLLKQELCSFFKEKLAKGDSCKRKMSCYIKRSLDKMCDFNLVALEEELDNAIYNFKVDFEMKYLNDEYCKDDFNKIIRAFKHTLMLQIREETIRAVGDVQDIVSRYADKGYQIVDHYRTIKRR